MRAAQSFAIAGGTAFWGGAAVWELAIFAKLNIIAADNATLKHILSTISPPILYRQPDYDLPPVIASGPGCPVGRRWCTLGNELPLWVDFVAKVQNRTSQKISPS